MGLPLDARAGKNFTRFLPLPLPRGRGEVWRIQSPTVPEETIMNLWRTAVAAAVPAGIFVACLLACLPSGAQPPPRAHTQATAPFS